MVSYKLLVGLRYTNPQPHFHCSQSTQQTNERHLTTSLSSFYLFLLQIITEIKACNDKDGHIAGNARIIVKNHYRNHRKHRLGTVSKTLLMGSLNAFCSRWCKREHVECDALKDWKLNIFKIIDRRISFCSQNTNMLPREPKINYRYLKSGIEEFHRKYVLVPADKAANNVVVV